MFTLCACIHYYYVLDTLGWCSVAPCMCMFLLIPSILYHLFHLGMVHLGIHFGAQSIYIYMLILSNPYFGFSPLSLEIMFSVCITLQGQLLITFSTNSFFTSYTPKTMFPSCFSDFPS